MKTRIVSALMMVWIACGINAVAGAVPGTLSPDYLDTATWLERVVVGADLEMVGRTVDTDLTDPVSLDVNVYSGFIGYDVTPYVTTFLTVGSTDDNTIDDPTSDGGSGSKISAGVNVNLSHYPIRHPDTVAGDRLTVQVLGEVAHYDADVLDWMQVDLALPITFEIIEDDHGAGIDLEDRFVLAVYAGPLASYVDGQLDTPEGDVDFEADQILGLLAGADLRFTRYFSVGGHIRFFNADDDETSGGASLRYHF